MLYGTWPSDEVVRRPRPGERHDEAGLPERRGVAAERAAEGRRLAGGDEKCRVEQQPRAWRRLLGRAAPPRIGGCPRQRRVETIGLGLRVRELRAVDVEQ